MPGVLSEPNNPWMNQQGPPASAMHHNGRGFRGEEWNMKQPQERSQGMMAPQQQGPGMQTSHGWECANGWQGQLGPNLMPMTAGQELQRGPMAQPLPGGGGGMHNMPNMREMGGGSPHNMQNMQEPPRGGMLGMHDVQGRGGNMQNMQEPLGGMQNMQGGNMQNMQQPLQNVHNMRDMQDLRIVNMLNMQNSEAAHYAESLRRPNVQNLPLMHNMQNGMGLPGNGQEMSSRQGPKVMESSLQPQPLMQVITLPVGAPAPEGAIPAGMQMIAVPAGEAPPEGAIPVGEGPQGQNAHSWQSESASMTNENRRASNKAFKIKNPLTGLEVGAPGEETAAASRRLRIVNPKTGEEVRPCL